ncbi:PREDICTED: uncharacterized protein LOC18603679 [Theobroma cacao]|uniref:Uncharacterized protein LOC18603679 n=1 Tax=Theobroma cacao TaxID=3641 RepID=A0AB32V8M0_THECC|nr:PREDICTED: uncharacterized protein LOC18603679 [Theobroma cacao]XP_017974753.1 PREDICTED: uncharacterized protein LOC18603679 [Theobroma cacao]
MKEKENQMSRKEHPRSSSDLANRRSKDSPAKKTSKKTAQKSLTEAFASPVEDVLPEISEESFDFSSISAISDSNYNGETTKSFVMASYPSLSTSTETFTPSELTPCSKISTVNRDEQIDFSKIASAEVEIVVNLIKKARLQALNSVDMENKSKKVLDELIKFIINEFYSLPQERDKIPHLVSRNAYVGFLCFLLWIVVVLLFSFYLFYYSRLACSFTGLPPT